MSTSERKPIDSHLFWARALTDQAHFELERERLANIWTLVGLTNDLESDRSWFRATLGGRSIFIQRFGEVLRGFENRCAHRHFPLRTEEKGAGPIVCGFHHWRYDPEGRAVGIPMCSENYGMIPRELGAKLEPVEVATCGSLVFARFPSRGATESLDEFLGDGFAILQTVCNVRTPRYVTRVIAANWKLSVEITLDDYHLVAVHPSTFGKGGYLKNDAFRYFQFGKHSAHFMGSDETMAEMATACRLGNYRPRRYRIFNIFPNLAISVFDASPYWYAFVQQFVPLAPDRTIWRGWFYPLPVSGIETLLKRGLRLLTEPVRAQIVRYYIRKIGNEDHTACERLQTVAHQVPGPALLGTQEERIGWFEDAYKQAMSDGVPAP